MPYTHVNKKKCGFILIGLVDKAINMVKYIRFTYIKINLTINSFRHWLKTLELAGNIEWWIKHFAFRARERERRHYDDRYL